MKNDYGEKLHLSWDPFPCPSARLPSLLPTVRGYHVVGGAEGESGPPTQKKSPVVYVSLTLLLKTKKERKAKAFLGMIVYTWGGGSVVSACREIEAAPQPPAHSHPTSQKIPPKALIVTASQHEPHPPRHPTTTGGGGKRTRVLRIKSSLDHCARNAQQTNKKGAKKKTRFFLLLGLEEVDDVHLLVRGELLVGLLQRLLGAHHRRRGALGFVVVLLCCFVLCVGGW